MNQSCKLAAMLACHMPWDLSELRVVILSIAWSVVKGLHVAVAKDHDIRGSRYKIPRTCKLPINLSCVRRGVLPKARVAENPDGAAGSRTSRRYSRRTSPGEGRDHA